MKVKKLLAGLLTAAMIGTMMMGCSSSEEASTEGDASAETTQAAEETTEETAEEAEYCREVVPTLSMSSHLLYPTRRLRPRLTQRQQRQRSWAMK